MRIAATTATLVFAALAVSGCASSGLSLGQSTQTASPAAPATQTVAATDGRKISDLKLVAVAPIVLTPSHTATAVQMQDQLLRDLNSLATRHNFALITGPDGSEALTLRGYVLATRDARGVKITQIWDVTDRTGARVNRTQREQVHVGPVAGDLWAAAGRIDTMAMAEMAVEVMSGAAPARPSGVGTLAVRTPPAEPVFASPSVLVPPIGPPAGNMATGVGATRPRF